MEFVRRGDENRLHFFALEHGLQASVGIFNFEIVGDLPRTLRNSVGYRDEARLWDEAP
jgi:hypothetical protein